MKIINSFKSNKINLVSGPQLNSYALNFLSLIQNKDIDGDYFAFADQDDIWNRNKLEIAINKIKHIKSNIPAAYCSRSILIDKNDKHIGLSKNIKIKPNFKNSLIQNIMSGNTIVFNRCCKKIIENAKIRELTSHDWLIYQIITGSEGYVFFDKNYSIFYRQHTNNLIGAQNSFYSLIKRFRYHFNGYFEEALNKQLKIYTDNKFLLSKNNRAIFEKFLLLKNHNSFLIRLLLFRHKIVRFSIQGNIALFFSLLLKRI